jgi:hypothetical protein
MLREIRGFDTRRTGPLIMWPRSPVVEEVATEHEGSTDVGDILLAV